MKLIVTSADLKWQGKRLKRGERFEAATDRDQKLAELLKKLGKASDAPAGRPVREVASVKPAPAPEPEPEAPMRDTVIDWPAPRPYRTRRLKADE
jgi:hypothetical protein